MSAIVGKKLGMTRVFGEDGAAIPVTVIEAEPNKVTAIRKADRDGYDAIQLAAIPVAERKLTKGELGHLTKAGAGGMKALVEFRDVSFPEGPSGASASPTDASQPDTPAGASSAEGDAKSGAPEDVAGDVDEPKVGDSVTVATFQPGDKVKVSAVSIGKGFQGTVKRHGFTRGPVTHGSHNVRAPGSIGASADPARVFKGVRMPGQMGAKRVTQRGATVVEVDAERNLLLIKGSVPGATNATVEVRTLG
ncbi:MAG: 50S ribosomal protein L3 [Solirubrobacterales bacterium]